uniref:Uncharacterized protein n=1 Tax=Rhizophora mucronata TaxID=61149 RepID=A0A2P2N2A5_RHIMU
MLYFAPCITNLQCIYTLFLVPRNI